MPYVRQRTWIQMAPRIHLVKRGMGQAANCPSLEQLQGIADSNDPCQNPIASLPLATVPTLISPGSLPNPQQQAAANLLLSGLPPTAPAQTLTQFLTQYQTPILIGGGLLFGIVLLKGLRR